MISKNNSFKDITEKIKFYISNFTVNIKKIINICMKLLKMDYIRDTKHESKIYCEDGQRFMKSMEKIQKLEIRR